MIDIFQRPSAFILSSLRVLRVSVVNLCCGSKMPDSARMPSRLQVWRGSTFGHAAPGAALLWAAPPPLAWWPLAWIAPIPWVLLIRRKELPPLEIAPRLGAVGLLLWAALSLAAFMGVAGAFNESGYRGFWLTEAVVWPGTSF